MRRIIEGGIQFQNKAPDEAPAEIGVCEKCGAASNHHICMACKLLDRLAKGHAARQVVEDPAERFFLNATIIVQSKG
jgi:cytoplasmic tRNA 2-thiolation protein 1